jgi:hypothetical protein
MSLHYYEEPRVTVLTQIIDYCSTRSNYTLWTEGRLIVVTVGGGTGEYNIVPV